MADIVEERRREFFNPRFDTGFWSERWLNDNKQDAYATCLTIAWKTLLAEDDWYAWLRRHHTAMGAMDNEVWFQDGRRLSLRKAPGRAGVIMTVPAEVFGGAVGGIDLMRAVIVAVYNKAAEVLGIESPPLFDVPIDALRQPLSG